MPQGPLRRDFLKGAITGALVTPPTNVTAQELSPLSSVLDVRVAGARGDGQQLDTAAFQAAIDRLSAAGGGTLYVPPGRYLLGTLQLRSHVLLYLEAGAVLLGSPRLEDYPPRIPEFRSYTDNYTERSLIYAERAENVGIAGRGVIDGQGASFKGPYKVRPYLIRMVECRRVHISGIRLQNSPMWVQHYLACDDVWIDGIEVRSHVNQNNDGLDIDCCHRVTIANCNIDSGDDAIVLKSTADRPTRDVTITNCVLRSNCNAFKLGTESNGGFQNVVLANCAMYDTRLSGIAIETVDGGTSFNIAVSNVTMRGVRNPIFIRLGNRGRPFREGDPKPGVGTLRSISICNVYAEGADQIGCPISGIPGHPIEDVRLDNIRIRAAGGVDAGQIPKEVPEREADYPEYKMFGLLPAYAFYCRHVRRLRMSNLEVGWERLDARPALVLDDVSEVTLQGLSLQASSVALRLRNVRDVLVGGCQLQDRVEVFAELEQTPSREVALLGNDLRRARRPARGGEVFLASNR